MLAFFSPLHERVPGAEDAIPPAITMADWKKAHLSREEVERFLEKVEEQDEPVRRRLDISLEYTEHSHPWQMEVTVKGSGELAQSWLVPNGPLLEN